MVHENFVLGVITFDRLLVFGWAGSVPIVTGPPNIDDFAPAENSLIYIKDLAEAKAAAQRIKYLAGNETAYNETLR